MWKQNVDKINEKKVMLIQSFSPWIKLHMLGAPRKNLTVSGGTSEEPKQKFVNLRITLLSSIPFDS